MPKTFSYTSDQVAELQEAYLAETGRNQRKIQIVMLRAQGMKVNDVIKITKTSTTTITRLTKLYADKGVPGLCASNYHGHNQYLTYVSRGTLFRHPFVTLFRPETTLFRRTNVTFLIFNLVIRQIIPSVGLEY